MHLLLVILLFQKIILTLWESPEHECMAPVPQYATYYGSGSLLNVPLLGYGLDENNDCATDFEKQKVAVEYKATRITPRCLVVIQPGNPNGNCLTKDSIKNIIQLDKDHGMDEVYQEIIYGEKAFISFRSVLDTIGPAYNDVKLPLFHSIYTADFGECGSRGGYLELRSTPAERKEQLYKFSSISLCSDTVSKVIDDIMFPLPRPGEPSYESNTLEKKLKYESLLHESKMVNEKINKIQGVSFQHVAGALYLPTNYPSSQRPRKKPY
jgi:alanine transaminase